MTTLARRAINFALFACLSSCSASPAPQQSTAPSEVRSASRTPVEPSAQPNTKNEAATAPATQSEQTPAPSSGDGLRKASRPPVELITNPTALYVFNFSESDVGTAAQQKCETASESRRELSACLQKARDKVPLESIRFVKKGAEYWWITLNRYKGNLLKWHVIQVKVGEEKPEWLVLKPMGKDKGIAPMAKIPRTLEIAFPNDYSIALNDPEFGKMVFDAKLGKIEE